MRYFVLGRGYLGKQFAKHFKGYLFDGKIRSQSDITDLLEDFKPKVVINCAGKTGRPNIDWCESHKEETFFGNVTLPSFVCNACQKFDIKMVHVGSGCVYQGDNGGEGFTEEDRPNFDGSYYSWTKIVSERYLSDFNALQLRIRMPISGDRNPRNLFAKLAGYKKVVNAKNSVTCVPDLLAAAEQLIAKDCRGIYNVVHGDPTTPVYVLNRLNCATGSNAVFDVVNEEDLRSVTLAPRSNCVLSNAKLRSEGIMMRDTTEAIDACAQEYAAQEIAV